MSQNSLGASARELTPDAFVMSSGRPGVRTLLLATSLLLAVVAVYWPAFQSGYVWDDRELLVQNPHVTQPGGIAEIWTSAAGPDFFPLTLTAAWLEYRAWGDWPAGFHAVNIALHALGVMLLWLVLRRLKLPGAWLAALLFAIHPVNVASVAWVAELKNVLSFALAAGAALPALRERPDRSRASEWTALALFVLALLAKTSLVCLPPILLLCEWWRGGLTRREFRSELIRLAPWFVAALVLGLVTVWFQSQNVIGEKVVRPEGWLSRFTAVGWCVAFYVSKGFAPLGLSMIYPRFAVDPANPLHHLPNAVLLLTLGVAWWLARAPRATHKHAAQPRSTRQKLGRAVLFLLGFWLLALAPVLGAFDMYFFLFSLVSDHLQHLALVGTTVALAAGIHWVWHRGRLPAQLVAGTCVVVILGAFAFLTWERAQAFASLETLWEDTLAKNPEAWVAHNGLGILAANAGDEAGAIAHYQAALAIRPEYPEALNNLGVLQSRGGNTTSAIAHLRQAVALDANYYEAWSNLGNALAREIQYEPACEAYLQAIAIEPTYVKAHYNLGIALGKRWLWQAAAESFAKAVELDPGHSRARLRWGEALLRDQQYTQAVRVLAKASQLDKNNAALQSLYQQARQEQAKAELRSQRYR